ncbi:MULTISPECIES: RraA family protein [Prauserella salsuginis group]|uniref:Putative 4-hydroxy-4-methyl-2-oxoglutarate aldolase n=1 Tax=Prauserella salsuginis TaxID=387889 RepID=A0ABW6G0P7_9PSEU|nr:MULTISPECIES: RraA family protein [Prauserella salsuginis group]MCR3721909.1 Regulator of RNase E activity RraA [Prauserella flava]MCR3735914.1 Regulator of RNase E activity RraA [Prauserella salsuginis]
MPRHDPSILETWADLPGLTALVADALDELGAGAVLGTRAVAPLAPNMRVCGPAVTLRYVGVQGEPGIHRAAGASVLAGDRDLYAVASPGDVAVVDCGGVTSAVMGGLSAQWALTAGVAGCVVDGAVRDATAIVDSGLPVWSRHRTPLAARHRVEAIALNDVVNIGGRPVRPGDHIVGDLDGICIIPHQLVPTVAERCLTAHDREERLMATIADATDLDELVRATRSTRVAD